MKRKNLALLLCAALLLTACTAAPTTTAAPTETTTPVETIAAPAETTVPPTTIPETTAPAPHPVCQLSSSTATVGNLQIPIPDGFSAEIVNDNSIMLKNEVRTCGVILFAADISDLDEETVQAYLPMQQEQFLTADVVRGDTDVYEDMSVAGIPVAFQAYGEMYTDLSTQMVLEATFTDSWYAYTIKMVEPIEDDYNGDNITSVMTALLLATHTGPAARFDFVQ